MQRPDRMSNIVTVFASPTFGSETRCFLKPIIGFKDCRRNMNAHEGIWMHWTQSSVKLGARRSNIFFFLRSNIIFVSLQERHFEWIIDKCIKIVASNTLNKNLSLFFLCVACGILVLRIGIKLVYPALKVWRPNHWTLRGFPKVVKIWTCILQKLFSQWRQRLSLVKCYSSWKQHLLL